MELGDDNVNQLLLLWYENTQIVCYLTMKMVDLKGFEIKYAQLIVLNEAGSV